MIHFANLFNVCISAFFHSSHKIERELIVWDVIALYNCKLA